MGILEKLRQQQRAAGLVAPANPEAPVDIPNLRGGVWNKAMVLVNPEPSAIPVPAPVMPAPITPSERTFDIGSQRGYIRLFPPQCPSLAQLTEEWKKENWTAPSPWCSVEGQPNHPDFEKNVNAI